MSKKEVRDELAKRVKTLENMPLSERPAGYARELRFAKLAVASNKVIFDTDHDGRPSEESQP